MIADILTKHKELKTEAEKLSSFLEETELLLMIQRLGEPTNPKL
jgi:hypothetical protein